MHGRFDVVLLPRPDDPVSGALVAAADIPVRVGYGSPRTRPSLTHALPPPGRAHVVSVAIDAARAVAQLLGATGERCTGTAQPFDVMPTAADHREVSAILAAAPRGARADLFVLHPGSGWPLKNWPVDRWAQFAVALARRYGVVPLITGGPQERPLVDAIVASSAGHTHGVAGRLSLGGLAALYRRAHLVIATDGAPLHLAALLGVRVVGLYGPADPLQFAPWCPADRQRVIAAPLPCRPCRTLRQPPCGAVTEPRCITDIAVEHVLGAVDDLLARRDSPRCDRPAVCCAGSQRVSGS